MVRFRQKLDRNHKLYIVKPLRDSGLTNTIEILPNSQAAIIYRAGTKAADVLASLQTITLELQYRAKIEAEEDDNPQQRYSWTPDKRTLRRRNAVSTTSPLDRFLRQNCNDCKYQRTCANPSNQQLQCILAQIALELNMIAADTAETRIALRNIEENGVSTFEEKLTESP